MQPSMKWWKYF